MLQWFAVYRVAGGELVSTGTAVADPLPEGLDKLPIEGDPAGLVWDPATLAFAPPPPPDLAQVPVDTDVILHALGPALRIRLRASADPRVQDFAYCLGAMNTVLASEVVAALQIIEALGFVNGAERAALAAAILPEG